MGGYIQRGIVAWGGPTHKYAQEYKSGMWVKSRGKFDVWRAGDGRSAARAGTLLLYTPRSIRRKPFST